MIGKILYILEIVRAERDVAEQVWFVPNTVGLFGRTAQPQENSTLLTLI